MTWNNRIFRHKDKDGRTVYGLHETFYDDKGKVEGYTKESMIGLFESKAELVKCLELMLKDARKRRPVLDYRE